MQLCFKHMLCYGIFRLRITVFVLLSGACHTSSFAPHGPLCYRTRTLEPGVHLSEWVCRVIDFQPRSFIRWPWCWMSLSIQPGRISSHRPNWKWCVLAKERQTNPIRKAITNAFGRTKACWNRRDHRTTEGSGVWIALFLLLLHPSSPAAFMLLASAALSAQLSGSGSGVDDVRLLETFLPSVQWLSYNCPYRGSLLLADAPASLEYRPCILRRRENSGKSFSIGGTLWPSPHRWHDFFLLSENASRSN